MELPWLHHFCRSARFLSSNHDVWSHVCGRTLVHWPFDKDSFVMQSIWYHVARNRPCRYVNRSPYTRKWDIPDRHAPKQHLLVERRFHDAMIATLIFHWEQTKFVSKNTNCFCYGQSWTKSMWTFFYYRRYDAGKPLSIKSKCTFFIATSDRLFVSQPK